MGLLGLKFCRGAYLNVCVPLRHCAEPEALRRAILIRYILILYTARITPRQLAGTMSGDSGDVSC